MKAPLSFEFLPQQGSAEDSPHLTMAFRNEQATHFFFMALLHFYLTKLNYSTSHSSFSSSFSFCYILSTPRSHSPFSSHHACHGQQYSNARHSNQTSDTQYPAGDVKMLRQPSHVTDSRRAFDWVGDGKNINNGSGTRRRFSEFAFQPRHCPGSENELYKDIDKKARLQPLSSKQFHERRIVLTADPQKNS
jgi:hypothetical protein